MGRIEMDTTTSCEQGTVDAPPPIEDDLYEPQPPIIPPSTTNSNRSTPPPPPPPPAEYEEPPHHYQPQVHHYPPPQDPIVHQFPPPPMATPPPQHQQAAYHFTAATPNQYQQHHPNVQNGIPLGIQYNQLPTHPWSSNLFDCMNNPQNAIITLFLPCVTFGQIAEILDAGSTSCGTSGMLYSVIACCIAMPCIMSCTYRTKLRSKYGLDESPAPDWVIHCFCEYCALCQEYRELEHRGFDPTVGWLGNVAKQQQNQQQFGMTPPMQQRMY